MTIDVNRGSIVELFPRPLVYYRLPDDKFEILQSVATKVKENRGDYAHMHNPQNRKLSHFLDNSNDNIFDQFELHWYKQWLEDCAKDFVENVKGLTLHGSDMQCVHCWMNQADRMAHQYVHNHTNSIVSGTQYIHFNKEKNMPLSFFNPWVNQGPLQPSLDLQWKEHTAYNYPSIQVVPDEGDLILWDSNIYHGYDIDVEGDRTTFSMNFMPYRMMYGNYGFSLVRD